MGYTHLACDNGEWRQQVNEDSGLRNSGEFVDQRSACGSSRVIVLHRVLKLDIIINNE